MPHEPVLVGIDLGTTGCRSAAFDERLRILAESYVEYHLIHISASEIEQDAGLWWALTLEVLRTLDELVHPDMRLILDIKRTEPDDGAYNRIAERNYKLAAEKLSRLYRQ